MTVEIGGVSCTLADRVLETTQTTGTGAYALDGVSTDGYQSFVAGVGNGNNCPYVAELGTSWEVGVGQVTSGAPNTLSRDVILASSNSGSAVAWSAGVKTIKLDAPAALLTQIPDGSLSTIARLAALNIFTVNQEIKDDGSPASTIQWKITQTATGLAATFRAASFGVSDIGTTTDHDFKIRRNSADFIELESTGVNVTQPLTESAARVVSASSIFESSALSITTGSLVNTAHSLGAAPKQMWAVLRNATTEFGFSVGDEVQLNNYIDDNSGGDNGFLLGADATNIFYYINSPLRVVRKDTGALDGITTGNWTIVLRGWV